MKSNIVIYYILTTFFLIVAAMYTVWHMISYNGEIEWAGSMALLACSILFAFIAYYLNLHYKKQGGELTEDLLEADIDDGDPEIGEFSPWSWWPIILAGAIALAALGLATGFFFWLSFFSIPFIVVGVVGLVYEYYRGYFAR
ncbi:MAG: aa3-type cytochrome oxidase subunit IV [Canibacter sp.]